MEPVKGEKKTGRGRPGYPRVLLDRAIYLWETISLSEAVRITGVSRRTLYYYRKSKKLDAVKGNRDPLDIRNEENKLEDADEGRRKEGEQ